MSEDAEPRKAELLHGSLSTVLAPVRGACGAENPKLCLLEIQDRKAYSQNIPVQHIWGTCPKHVMVTFLNVEYMKETLLFHWEFSLPWKCRLEYDL